VSSPNEVWDAGLQPERTSLAWQRTALAFFGLGLAVPKLAWTALGAWSILPAGVVVVGALALFVVGQRRYRRTHDALTGDSGYRHDGRLPLLATLVGILLAVVALILVAVAAGTGGG